MTSSNPTSSSLHDPETGLDELQDIDEQYTQTKKQGDGTKEQVHGLALTLFGAKAEAMVGHSSGDDDEDIIKHEQDSGWIC